MKCPLLIFPVLLFLNSCVTGQSPGNDEPAPPAGGCCLGFLTSPETPFWYPNLEESELSDARELCESVEGQWSAKDCSTSGIMGGCHYQDTAIPYIQLFPESLFGKASEEVARYHCPTGVGVQWITEFK